MPRLPGRPQPAPNTGTTQRVPIAVAQAPVQDGTPRRQPGTTSRRSIMERRVLIVGGALLGGVLAAAVLAGSLSDAMTSRAAALEASTTNAAIQGRVEAGRREVEFAKTTAFLGFTARAFGYGHIKERAFALDPGGPPPPSIEPLGGPPMLSPPADPLGSVLDLLFER